MLATPAPSGPKTRARAIDIDDTDRRTADAGEHIEDQDDAEPGDGDQDDADVEERFLVRFMTDRDPTLLRDFIDLRVINPERRDWRRGYVAARRRHATHGHLRAPLPGRRHRPPGTERGRRASAVVEARVHAASNGSGTDSAASECGKSMAEPVALVDGLVNDLESCRLPASRSPQPSLTPSCATSRRGEDLTNVGCGLTHPSYRPWFHGSCPLPQP
ncbi:helicase associated domain-containing protein (plasmid) [Embleya sp. NBC_00888]|uniref:helicase associated domain-containing protein n=1 Tax=Embleya sp. NBC_00888 TaxID=2975960 RepID=UPI002F9164D5|nr:helicase associated domain-containing protein [Embleya sp. NBC_00888]